MSRFTLKKGTFFRGIQYGFPALLFILLALDLVWSIREQGAGVSRYALSYAGGFILVVAVYWFLSRIAREAYYELDDHYLAYSIGWWQGRIPLQDIQWVKPATYPSAGNRPALARRGLLIGYGAGYTLFISPEDVSLFREELEARLDAVRSTAQTS